MTEIKDYTRKVLEMGGGSITLPKEYREDANIKIGDELKVFAVEDMLLVVPKSKEVVMKGLLSVLPSIVKTIDSYKVTLPSDQINAKKVDKVEISNNSSG